MAKWADYLITTVERTGGHVTRVRICEDLGSKLGPTKTVTKNWVLSMMIHGWTFATVTWDSSIEKWTQGADVGHEYFTISDSIYLRTDRDKTAKDNLLNLPRF